MKLEVLPETFAICRLPAGAPFPVWAGPGFVSLTRTKEEVSVVCEQRLVPAGTKAENGWRAFRVAGTLDFALTGILARISTTLAQAGVSIFAVSTFDTDYILVREAAFDAALGALVAAGLEVAK